MRKKLTKVLAAMLLLCLTCSLVSCANNSGSSSSSGASSSAPASDSIKFAVMGPMTGDAAAQGKQQEFGVRLAVQEINAAGGINGKKLEYDVYDDQLNTNQAVICAEKIISNPDYRFVISSISSGCSKAAYPTFLTKDLPVISGINTADMITALGFKNYLRICYKDSALIKQLVDLAINKNGYKKPAIFYTNSEIDTGSYNACVADLQAIGIKPVATAQIDANAEKDFNGHITDFMGAGADCYFNFSEYTPGALFLKQKYAAGWKVPGFSIGGCSNPQLITIAGNDAAEGFVTMSGFVADNPDPRIAKFVSEYEKLAGFQPGEWAAGAYDSIYVVAEALKNSQAASLTGNAFVEWMRANTNYDGIMGHVTFDQNGDNPSAKAVLQRVVGGKLTVYNP